MYHSERLALAYALFKNTQKSIPATKIVITKNIRICGNCHESFKKFSDIYKYELVVRDTSRFHVFKNGKCSCNDYY